MQAATPGSPSRHGGGEGGRVRLSTTARFRTVVWPRYDAEDDLEIVFGRFGEVVGARPDVTLCLLHDRRRDVPLDRAVETVERVLARTAAASTGLDVLLVDDLDGPAEWAALGRSVDWALALPSSGEGLRAEFLTRVGIPVLRTPDELSRRLDSFPPLPVLPRAGALGRAELDIVCGRKNLFLVRGRPGQGKTSFAFAFCRVAHPAKQLGDPGDSLHTLTTLIGLDRMYVRFVRARCPEKVPACWNDGRYDHINTHYSSELTDAERDVFLDDLAGHIEAALATSGRNVIVEGWHLLTLTDRLVERFRERVNLVPVELDGNVVRVGRGFEHDATVRLPIELVAEDDGARAARAEELNVAAACELVRYVKLHYLRGLMARTGYQCFDDLGQPNHNSDSRGKLERLNLPELAGSSVLDVGCNAGYFSIKMRERGAASVLGVDTSAGPLDLARWYRDLIYEYDNIDFLQADVFELDDDRRFDLVVSLSVFHYFRERQGEFLDRVHHLLKPGGLLILECGLSALHPERPFVEKAARTVDGDNPCHFPNERALLEMAHGFRLELQGPSTMQPGDRIPRSVLHLRKRDPRWSGVA